MTRGEYLRLPELNRANEALALWRAGNDAGEGFAGDDIGGERLTTGAGPGPHHTGRSGDQGLPVAEQVAVYDTGTEIVAVADAGGPWAVVIAR